jgi:hypothetical protein
VSSASNPQEEIRKQIDRLFEEVARLSDSDLPSSEYFDEVLMRALQGLAAPAGAVWVRTEEGNLQLQHQINLRQVELEQDANRQSHDELLRQAFQTARAVHLPPHSSTGTAEAGRVAPGNPTAYDILLVPIVIDQVVAGLIEVWQGPNRKPSAFPGFLKFLERIAHLASLYMRSG